jgi:uncharacterized membrane protein YczE
MTRALARGSALLVGLAGYGLSMAVMVRAGLGLDPWDVFHQGLAGRTGMTIGIASAVVGVAVLVAWIPLRNRPGIGTVANVIVIALTVDAALAVLPTPSSLPVRIAMMIGAVVMNAVSTVLYIGAGLGPGPRDGLMTGLVDRTGLSVRLVRTSIEATVLVIGSLLGGTVGIGTLVYAFGIGPLVQMVLRLVPKRLLAVSGWAFTEAAPAAISGSAEMDEMARPTRTSAPKRWFGRYRVLVITEGNYLLLDDPQWARARAAMNAVWFVASEDAVRVQRLVDRHVRFGKTASEARAWVAGTDQRNSDLVSPTLAHADRVVVNGSGGWGIVE